MEQEKTSLQETLVAILIAVATVIGAVIAWRASVVADAAGDADFAGMKASLNAAETRALNFVNAYEHYGAYTTYSRYNELGNEIGTELQTSQTLTEEQTWALQRQQSEAYDLAKANQTLFPNRFMNRDNTYSVTREMGEGWADASREKDLNPDPQYAEADVLRGKTNKILAALGVLSLSLVFFAMVESVGERIQWLMVTLGVIFMLGGGILAFLIETMK
jgi:hypothetical protein